jgi:hypothetical protein
VINKDFTVRWDKKNWEFKVVPSSTDRHTTTYHGKIEKAFFLVEWNRHNDTYEISCDFKPYHTGSAWFSRTIAESIQTIMANRAGLSQYERHRKNYPTAKSSAPTSLYIGNARVYVVRYIDNSRWWYEATSASRDDADWESKFFKSDIQPSKEHLLKQMIKGDFVFYETKEVVVPFSLPHENGEKEVQSISLPHEINGESE